jgi:hypothetical protein
VKGWRRGERKNQRGKREKDLAVYLPSFFVPHQNKASQMLTKMVVFVLSKVRASTPTHRNNVVGSEWRTGDWRGNQ